jgi:AraC family transcriptional regulator
MTMLQGYTLFDYLQGTGVPLRASARFGEGFAAALWERNDRIKDRFPAARHHTLSFYISGGEGIRRLRGRNVISGDGAGSLYILPAGVAAEFDSRGMVRPARVLHFYIPKPAFERRVVETLDADPRAVSPRDWSFHRDPTLERIIRSTMLPLSWEEPADRVALTHACELLTAYLVARCSERAPGELVGRGGLAPRAVRRVLDYVEAHLEQGLTLAELAAVAGLSPYHFAHAFKRSS